jgi:hypothetical protein
MMRQAIKPTFVLIDERTDIVEKLRAGLEGFPYITVMSLRPSESHKIPELDAEYLSLPAAERWGARPLVHQAQVLEIPAQDREKHGMPRYVITGVAMAEADPRDPRFELKLWMRAVVEAVNTFNRSHANPIQKIGVWTEWIGLNRIDAKEGARLLRSTYSEASGQ